jgi:predicted amino acid-binding ACT domain protein
MTSNSQTIIPTAGNAPEKESLATPLHGSVWRRKGRKSLTVTFSTEDRTGLVLKIADMVARHKLRIVRHHGATVDDVATSLFILEGSEVDLKQFEEDFKSLNEVDGKVEGDVLHSPVNQFDIHFVAEDRPGLLRDVSKVFASRGINMIQLEGFLHIERKPSVKPKTGKKGATEISWAVFFIRIELLQAHLDQIEEVKAALRELGEFVEFKDHVFQGFEQRNQDRNQLTEPSHGGRTERDRNRFFSFFDAIARN